jgi:hypothetical protein
MATDIDHFRALAAPASSMRQNLGHRRAKFARTGQAYLGTVLLIVC